MKVLVVEDEIMHGEAVVEFLSMHDIVCQLASSVSEAMQLYGIFSPDVILSDIQMPHEDGIALLKRVASRPDPRPKIIMMSGFSVVSEEELLKLGASAFVAKPLDFPRLPALIQRIAA